MTNFGEGVEAGRGRHSFKIMKLGISNPSRIASPKA